MSQVSHPFPRIVSGLTSPRLAGRVSGSLSPDPLGELMKKNDPPPDRMSRPVLSQNPRAVGQTST